MSETVTIDGIVLALGFLASAFIIVGGVADAFANGMADAQGDGGRQGCIILSVGVALFAVCLWLALR